MRHWRLGGRIVLAAFLVAAGTDAATAADMPAEVIGAAKVVCEQTFDGEGVAATTRPGGGEILAPQSQPAGLAGPGRKASAALNIDVKGATTSFPAVFQVPAEEPAYLVFEAAAVKPGRLIVHLQPAELPEELADKVQKEDWADPKRHYDVRALVALQPGRWQRYAIDLNSRVFEAITREKRPHNLAGVKIKAIGFEVNQPGEAGQQVLVDNVRVIGLGGMARRAYLQAQVEQLRSVLEEMSSSSPIAQYWRPAVNGLNMEMIAFDPAAPVGEWRDLSGRIETLIQASQKWPLAGGRKVAYLVGTETSLQRVSGHNGLYRFGGQIGQAVQLEAAGNEYESFQVVLMPLREGLKDVTIQCSDLKGPDGQASIPAKNVAFYQQIEQFLQPSLRTTDEQVGWTPDALLPVRGAFEVKDVEARPIWVTVYVPAETPAGEYAGKITVRAGKAGEQSVDLKIKVHGFAIPKVGQFRTQGHFGIQAVQQWYGEKYSPEVRKAFYRLMVEHRFSPTSQYSRMISPDPEDIPWVMKDGGNVIVIGGYHNKPLEAEKIGGWYDWLVKNSCVDKALIYIGDETDQYQGIREKALTIRKNWPKLRIMVGGSKPRPELIGYVDVWDPITSGGSIYDFDAKGSREAQGRGEEMFWYTCIGPRQPYANVCNDDPLTATRALWWQAWKYGITGFEYWGMNQWDLNMDLSKGEKPWPLGRIDEWNPRSYAWCNGDGLMVYPGPEGQPLSCNRFSVMRDAIEDWEVLFQLQRAVELAGKGEGQKDLAPIVRRAKALLDVPAEITADLTHWSEEPQVYLKGRHEAYELLAALRDKLGAKDVDAYTAKWVADHQKWMQGKFEERVSRFQQASER